MKTTSNIPREIQEYIDFMHSMEKRDSNILTAAKVDEKFEQYGNAINTFLAYPDLFVDLLSPFDSEFELYFVQRIVLRAMARHRQTFATFTRAFSKSFLAFLSRYIFTMLVPGHMSFVVSGTKQQAAAIAKEKVVLDLWNKFPLLAEEMKSVRVAGKLRQAYTSGKDYAEFKFTHGGQLDVVGTGSSTRGGRRHSGIFEEVIELDAVEINEVILPLMNKQRTTRLGRVNPHEPHSSKIYVTTAGYHGTYAYEKLIETLAYSIIDPDRYIVLGGSYEIPLMHGLLDPDQLAEVFSSPTYSKESADREYRSIWSGSMVGSAFSANQIHDLRKLVRAEKERRANTRDAYYIVSADMAKDGSANTVATIIKAQPKEYSFLYSVVNAVPINTTDYERVSAQLKHLVRDYDADMLVYDANGIGAAIRDWLNKEQFDPETQMVLPAYGIINPPERSKRDIATTSRANTICYEIKASGDVTGHINKVFFTKMGNKSVRFLIKSREAIEKFSEIKGFAESTNVRKKETLQPYFVTDKIEEEMRNLEISDVSDRVNPNILRVTQRNKTIQKDWYSALSYGVYACHIEFEIPYYTQKQRKGVNIADYLI